MVFSSWRGVVGVIKPTYRPGSLEEFIRLLPEGIGVIPLYLGIKRGTVLDVVKRKVAKLAALEVDLIHPEGAPPFMLLGYEGERRLIDEWEREFGKTIFTSGMSQVEALRALGVKKILGLTYFTGGINEKYARYFREAGFAVLAMEGMSVPFAEVGHLSPFEVYAFVKKQFLRYSEAEALYLLGTGWRILDIVQVLEDDLEVPVIHPVPARVWAVQKRLRVKKRILGYGRLLADMP